jgi:hypothetical protein
MLPNSLAASLYNINLVELEFVLQLLALLRKSGDAWQRVSQTSQQHSLIHRKTVGERVK